MDADETAAMVDIVLQCGLLPRAENFAGRAEEDQGGVFAEDLRAKPGRVDGRVDCKTILGAEPANSGDTRGNARMVVAVGFTEDEHFWLIEDLQGGAAGRGGEEPGREKGKQERFHTRDLAFLQRENVGDHRVDVVFLDAGVGGHHIGAPDAGASGLDLFDEVIDDGVACVSVFGGYIFISRSGIRSLANANGMAGGAIIGTDQLQTFVGSGGRGRGSGRGRRSGVTGYGGFGSAAVVTAGGHEKSSRKD